MTKVATRRNRNALRRRAARGHRRLVLFLAEENRAVAALGFAHAVAERSEVRVEIDDGPFDGRTAAIFVAALVKSNPAALKRLD